MKLFSRSEFGFFASESLTGHLLRGAAAIALLVWAINNQSERPVEALAAGAFSLLAFRGCPTCWTIGLFETIGQKMR